MPIIYDGTPYDLEDVEFHMDFMQDHFACRGRGHKCERYGHCHTIFDCPHIDDQDDRRIDYLGFLIEE